MTQCKFWNSDFTPERKYISHVRDNNTLKLKSDNTTPSDFWCLALGPETDGVFLYPECSSSSSGSSSYNVTLTPDSSNGVVYDHDEGLTFTYDSAGPYNLQEAQNYCHDLSLAGNNDWHLLGWELERVVGSNVSFHDRDAGYSVTQGDYFVIDSESIGAKDGTWSMKLIDQSSNRLLFNVKLVTL